MSKQEGRIREIVRKDPRFAQAAYYFVFEALAFTVNHLGRGTSDDEERHVTGRELLDGVREFALEQFGALARVVLQSWGVTRTEDIGALVFNLVEAELLFRKPDDTIEQFRDGFDFREAFEEAYRVRLPEELG